MFDSFHSLNFHAHNGGAEKQTNINYVILEQPHSQFFVGVPCLACVLTFEDSCLVEFAAGGGGVAGGAREGAQWLGLQQLRSYQTSWGNCSLIGMGGEQVFLIRIFFISEIVLSLSVRSQGNQ